MKKAIFYTVIFLGIQFIIGSAMQLVWKFFDQDHTIASSTQMIVMMAVFSAITIALFLGLKWAVVSRRYVRSRPWAALFWCALASVGAIIPSLWLQEQMPELPNVLEQEFDMILRNRWGYFVVGLLAPVAEELVFRGAILRALLEWCQRLDSEKLRFLKSHWTMIAVSALLFALVHGNPAQMPHAFVIGLLLGWMYWRTGSVVPGVVFHWVNNSLAYVLYNLYPSSSIKLVDIFGSTTHVLMAVGFSLLILLPALFQLGEQLKRA